MQPRASGRQYGAKRPARRRGAERTSVRRSRRTQQCQRERSDRSRHQQQGQWQVVSYKLIQTTSNSSQLSVNPYRASF
eukprot:6208801-Pleurochrysis_carterae.AAC.1